MDIRDSVSISQSIFENKSPENTQSQQEAF